MTTTTPLLLLSLFLLLSTTNATKHSFVTKHDARYYIGPIGSPYGFLKSGVYNLTVFDFDLTLTKKGHHHHRLAEDEDSDSDEDEDSEEKETKEEEEEEEHSLKGLEVGFILRKFTSESEYARFQTTIEDNPSICSFELYREHDGITPKDIAAEILGDDDKYNSKEEDTTFAAEDGVYLSMNDQSVTWKPHTPSSAHVFSVQEEGLYFLLYQVCPTEGTDTKILHSVRSSFELDLNYHNYDKYGSVSYLTAGEMPLPTMFLYFSISYALCLGLWAGNIRSIVIGGTNGGAMSRERDGAGQPVVYPIHHMMTILLGLKTASVFFESARYHFIRLSGHAELWSVVYYTFAFIKGTFLFTVILLIGSGWSFVKPFLNHREKKVIFLVLVLQVIDNVAVVILSNGMVGERLYEDWSAVLHLVDILCCCAVLIPIVWQVNNLEESMETRGGGGGNGEGDDEEEEHTRENNNASPENARMLSKLKMFRSFYLLVVCYIYFTRIVVYLFASVLDYHHIWLRYFVTELGTLAFYAVVGLQFRPMVENPYLEVKKDEDEDDMSFEGSFEMANKA